MSEWLKETGCKPVGSAYAGSNPAPSIAPAAAATRPVWLVYSASMRRIPVLALALLAVLVLPGAAHAACAKPAPEFPIATISTEGSRIAVGSAMTVSVSAGGQWDSFARAIRVTAINAATGERVDVGTATGVSVRFTPPTTGAWTFEATWEEAVCLSDDMLQIVEWRTRTTTGGRVEAIPAPSRTPKTSLNAYATARPGGALVAAGVRLDLDCRGRIADRPVGAAETVVRWTTNGRAPTAASRSVRARAASCTDVDSQVRRAGLANFRAEQATVWAVVNSPGDQGLALPGGAFPRPGPVIRAWLELRLGGKVLVATRARFTQRVVKGRFCIAGSCKLIRHVQTDVRPDSGPCPGMPGNRCRSFTRRVVGG